MISWDLARSTDPWNLLVPNYINRCDKLHLLDPCTIRAYFKLQIHPFLKTRDICEMLFRLVYAALWIPISTEDQKATKFSEFSKRL